MQLVIHQSSLWVTATVECLKEIKIFSTILLYQAEKLLYSLPSICILSLEQCCEGFLSSVSHNKYNLLLLISYILFAHLPYSSILSAKILPSHGDLLLTHSFYLYFSSSPTYTLKHTLNSLVSLSVTIAWKIWSPGWAQCPAIWANPGPAKYCWRKITKLCWNDFTLNSAQYSVIT